MDLKRAFAEGLFFKAYFFYAWGCQVVAHEKTGQA
jgi:hypothetical protein